MPKKRVYSKRNNTSLVKVLTLAGLFAAVGIPLVTLISMVASYKDHLEQDTAQIAVLLQDIHDLQLNSGIHNSDIEVFKQDIVDNSRDIDSLKKEQDDFDEKILEVFKETSSNSAQIESLKTEVLWIKSNDESRVRK